MDDEEPEIIGRGEWQQEANGDITYFPAHVRPGGWSAIPIRGGRITPRSTIP